MIPIHSMPFYAIYFIDSNTGCEIISKNFSQNEYDVNIISGMLKALELFINHLAYSPSFERLQEINFQGISVVYERYGTKDHPILCVGVSKRVENSHKEHKLLQFLVQEFYTMYRPFIESYHGDIRPFRSYQERLDRFQYEWEPILTFLDSSAREQEFNQVSYPPFIQPSL
ncbi:MAG: hypothetical protein ACTSVU_06950 [Promethearchaeota archaeon]